MAEHLNINIQASDNLTVVKSGTATLISANTGFIVDGIERYRTVITTPVNAIFSNIGFIAGANNATPLGTQQIAGNTMNLIPFFTGNSMLINMMYVNVLSGGVSATLRFVIYSNSSQTIPYPFKNVFSSALLAGSSVALVSANVGITLSANSVYWVGILGGTAANIQLRSVAFAGIYPFLGIDSALGQSFGWGIGSGYAAGTQPPAFFGGGGSVVQTGSGIPALFLMGSI